MGLICWICSAMGSPKEEWPGLRKGFKWLGHPCPSSLRVHALGDVLWMGGAVSHHLGAVTSLFSACILSPALFICKVGPHKD